MLLTAKSQVQLGQSIESMPNNVDSLLSEIPCCSLPLFSKQQIHKTEVDVLKELTRFLGLIIKPKKNVRKNCYLTIIFIIVI